MNRLRSGAVLVALFALLACGPGAAPSATEVAYPSATEKEKAPEIPSQQAANLALEISSTAFDPGGAIPDRHTCAGDNVSPPLAWSGIPEQTETLALLVEDPDSNPPGFSHWVIYNIPAAATGLEEDVPNDAELADGSQQGSNDFAPYGAGTFPGGAVIKMIGYDGPCPPGGAHHYVFTLYALDTSLDLPATARAEDVKMALAGHVLAQAELIGLFALP